MAEVFNAGQRAAVRQEIAAQVPQDETTDALRARLLDIVMRNGHEPNPDTAFNVAVEASRMGDVRLTAVALQAIPESTQYSMEVRARVFTTAVHNLRDGLLDRIEDGTATDEMREAFPIVQGLFNAMRDIAGTLEMTGPLFGDPHIGEGSRRRHADVPQVVPAIALPARR